MSDSPSLSAKPPVMTVEQMVSAIEAATAPSGVDWFLTPWPKDDPAARKARAVDDEAGAFHKLFSEIQPRRSKGGDENEKVGNWLNETITNSQTINDREARGKLWDGARRIIIARRDELAEIGQSITIFRERYELNKELTGNVIETLQRRVEDRLRDARDDAASWPWVTTLGVAMVGLGGGLLAAAGRTAAVKVGALFVGGVVGGAAGYGAGSLSADSVAGIAKLTEDLQRLKVLRERRSKIAAEGVKVKTIEGVVAAMEEYRGELRLAPDKDRRARLERKLEYKLRRLLEDDQNKKAASGAWAQVPAMLSAAFAARDQAKVGEAFAVICDIGNGFRREVEIGSSTRTQNLMGGWAAGRLSNPLEDPDAAWF